MFYDLMVGSKLMDDGNYTDEVKNYLRSENLILQRYLPHFECAIEVGCAWGRNLSTVENCGLSYIGIDYSQEYIMLAKQQFETSKSREFLLLNALQIAEIPKLSRVYIPSQKHLYFFPFNSFGNMPSPDKIINSFVSLENSSFMLFTYQTSSKANNERLKYYQNCGYLNLSCETSDHYVRFVSDEGLDCFAYEDSFFLKLSHSSDLKCQIVKFGGIGKLIIYSNL